MGEICNGLIYDELKEILQFAFNAIKIATPIIIIVMIVFDLISAVAAGKDEDLQKAKARAIKRVIVGIIIFFIPIIVTVLMNLVGRANGTCGIG